MRSNSNVRPQATALLHHPPLNILGLATAARQEVYDVPMKVLEATVVGGKIVSDDLDLADGTLVFIVSAEQSSPVRLQADELAELEAGIAEADRGELLSGDEFLEELRNFEQK